MSLGDLIIGLCNIGFGTVEATRRLIGRPGVKTITTSDLRAAMNSSGSSPMLVDVRSDAEHTVSRIPGAITKQEYETEAGAFSGRQVAVYCTVSGRVTYT